MSSVEQFEYHLYVRDDANPAIKQTSASALTMAGTLDTAKKSTLDFGAALQKIGQGAGFVRTSFSNVGASAKALKERMEPAAAAVSGVGAALGAAGGQAGKFVGAALQGAAAFGAAGPWGLALVGGTIALDEYTKTSKEAAAAEAVWKTALDRTLPAQEKTRDVVKSLAEEAKRYAEETRNAGKTQYEVSIATALAEKAVLETKLANIEASERLRQLAVNTAQGELESARARGSVEGMAKAQERLDMALLVQKEVRENAVVYRSQVASLEDSVWKIGEAWGTVEAKTRAAAGAVVAARGTADILAEPTGGTFDDTSFAGTDADVEAAKKEARRAGREAREAREAREDADRFNARIAREKLAADRIADLQEKAATERYERLKAIDQDYWGGLQGLAGQSFSIVADAGMQLVKELVTGQEHALERFAATSLEQAGSALYGFGVQAVGKGLLYAIDPITAPLAPAALATGAALMAAGAGMGAAGAAINASIPSTSSNAAATERGPSSLGSAGREVVAGTNVTIVYGGTSGPTAEHGVHAWTKAMTEAGGRFGLADSRTVDR